MSGHKHGCDCAHHRALAASSEEGAKRVGLGAIFLAILACSICPACLATYAKLFSVVGVGIGLSEFQHLLLLVVAVAASLGVSAWRSWRTKRIWPILVASIGAGFIVIGHVAGDLHVLEWVGVAILLVGGLFEHFRLQVAAARVRASAA